MSDDPEFLNVQEVPLGSKVDAPSRVVGIGGSAGGLEAFSELLRHLPKNTGMAFVFIQHLEPKQTSRLTEILARITEMPVEVAADGLRMRRDRVYVMPPGMDISLLDGALKLEPRTDIAGRHLPIDHFFRSLAKAQGNKSVAVILSGMGSDGTAGLKIVKESGGTTFAQDEPSAQYVAMPAAAADSGYVDIVTTPRKIAAELGRLARDRPLKAAKKRQVPESALKSIFALLRSKTEVDFTQYRKTVRRRIQRRLGVHRLDTLEDYVTFLRRNPDEIELCVLLMLQDLTDLQRLKQDVIDISEEEHRRFSRDLHDSHCQDLTAMAFFAETIAARLDNKDPENADQIRELGDMIRKSAENVHTLAANLDSRQIEQSGLTNALKELASRTSQRFSLACNAKIDRKCSFRDATVAIHLYRIAQEAISNAARHSGAKRIGIKVRLEGDIGILQVEDDGHGFAVEKKPAGFGLRTMEYRAALIKGSLSTVSTPGTGTVVTCSFPALAVK